MKSFSALALAFLASVVSAVPMAQTYDRIVVYKLKVAARSDIFLDGKYLGVRNSTIGIYDDAAEVQFYPMDSQQKGLVELHTYPIGIVDSVLGLVGSDGLLTWLEGTAWVTQNYLPIEVIYERVTRQIIG